MNMIKLWAVALCVSLGLLAMPAAVAGSAEIPTLNAEEQVKVKEELFAAFDRSNKPLERRKRFSDLSPQIQGKVLAYYAVGKKEQPDERILLKGVYNLLLYHENLKINEDALEVYKKTGKLPDMELPAVAIHAAMVTQSTLSGARYVNIEKARQIDELTTGLLEKNAALLEKNAALLEKNAALREKNAALREKNAALREKNAAEIRKNTELMKNLLKAL